MLLLSLQGFTFRTGEKNLAAAASAGLGALTLSLDASWGPARGLHISLNLSRKAYVQLFFLLTKKIVWFSLSRKGYN